MTERHGYRGSSQVSKPHLYKAWDNMKNRVREGAKGNPKFKPYTGIHVCPEWRDSFVAFKDWALAHGYEPGLTLDRIDSTGNYEPGNCHWVTKAENTRRAHAARRARKAVAS